MVALSNDDDAEVRLSGLTDGSKQGDSVVRYIFSLLGVKTAFESKSEGVLQTVTLRKSDMRLPQIEFDFTNAPDLAQTIVVSCCLLGVPFHFTGLSTLKIKETDRIEALKTELRKLGFLIVDRSDNELSWDGRRSDPILSTVPGLDGRHVVIDTYEDHRMAMAFAPAALLHPIVVNNPDVVTKSYPAFWDDLRQAGFTVTAIE
jgi:3-phosphoshikimate 1-carboxyvinyltransferase